MKKTLTINLGGNVYHIDEDAYQLLDKYLSALRTHFQKEEGAEEIMHDFEMRIAELFSERIRLGYEVITISETEDIIKRMGNPQELFGEEAEAEQTKEDSFTKEAKIPCRKRLYRNPDNRILGGVAGGLSAYLGWDVTAIRLILLLFLFFYGITFPLYLILWFIMPLARTATEKLEMRGESVTIESIGKTVTDGYERVSENIKNAFSAENPRTSVQKLADVIVSIVGVVLKILLILIAICILPPVLLVFFVLAIVVLGLLFGTLGASFGLLGSGLGALVGAGMLEPFANLPGIEDFTYLPVGVAPVMGISLLLIMSIPLVGLISFMATRFFNFKPMSKTVRYVLIALFFLAIVLMCVIVSMFPFSQPDVYFQQQMYSPVFYGIMKNPCIFVHFIH